MNSSKFLSNYDRNFGTNDIALCKWSTNSLKGIFSKKERKRSGIKIIFVCFYEAYPPVSGAASVTYNVAKYADGESILIQLGRQDCQELTVDGVRVITLEGASDSKWKKISGLSGKIRRIVENVASFIPDVVVLEGASWVLYHWLLIRQFRRKLPRVKVVYHSHNVEYFLRKEKHGRLVTKLTRWAEGRVLRKADLSYAVSEVDIRQFEELYGIRPKYLPNGVDLEKFDQVTETDIQALRFQYGLDDITILFMGSYLYKPNRDGIDFLIKLVMPKIVQQWPDVKLAVIGGEVPYNEPWLINPGSIPYEQLPAFIKACAIGIAPIFSGSGTRLKILEYMAAGKPVVATSKGAEGLSVQSGRDILIANEAEVFAAEIDRLLTDRHLAASIGERGRKVVNTHYSWKTIMQGFNETLNE